MGDRERSVEQIPALTTLRFLPALWVVLHHYGPSSGASGGWGRLMERGWMGVSFFFVLSGFILAVNYPVERLAARPFLAARFARIYPLYALGILLSVPLYFQGRLYFSDLPGAVLETVVQTLASVFLIQAWIPERAALLNPVGWSLSAEAFFYIAFVPLVSAGFSRRLLDRTVPATGVLWLAGLSLTALWMALHPGLVPGPGMTEEQIRAANLHSFHPLLRVPEFLLGVALGRFHLRGGRLPRPGTVVLGSLAGLAILVLALPRGLEPMLHNALAAPLFGLAILGIAGRPSGLPRILESRTGILLGESSYALYILHVPVHMWLRYVCGKIPLSVEHPAVVAGYLLAIVPISVLAFRSCETPARVALRRWLAPPRSAP